MRASARRKVDGLLLGAGALAAAGVTAVGGFLSDTERIPRLWVGAELQENDRASIVEVIDYDFGLESRHGIFRTIPGLTTDAEVVVDSATAPDRIESVTPALVGSEAGIEVKIGDPGITITGRHRYRIAYDHSGIVAGGRLVWDAVGTEWSVPIQQAVVHVVAPWRFADLACHAGGVGESGGCEIEQPEPGHLVAVVDSVDTGEGVTIEADRGEALPSAPELPAPPVDAPPDPGAGLLRPAATAGAVSLAGAAVTSAIVRRRGRERMAAGGGAAGAAWADATGAGGEVLVDSEELAGLATTEFAPPEGLTAPMGGIVLTEVVTQEHKVAWLIEAAIDGAVELVEEPGGGVRLERRDGGAPETRAILDLAFAGRPSIDLGSYDDHFAAAWKELDRHLEAWRAGSGLWDAEGDRRRRLVRALGALVAIVAGVATAVGGALAARWGTQWLPLTGVAAALAGAGYAAAVRGWELSVRTPQGSAAWLRVESFRRFLASSEAHHAEEAARLGVLREYTAWAVAVGEVDRWARAVAASTAIPQEAGLGYVHVAPALVASTAKTVTAPSSSGGGGGGSVGGGGGGGGGGSW